jgi:hypothetical protein
MAVLGIVVLFSGFWLGGCKDARPKPNKIPGDSVYVEGGKFYYWARCSYDPNQDADLCQTFNSGGDILEDGIFLPYDGGGAAKESELYVDGRSHFSGPYTIGLKNGRILIPKSDFDNQKRGIDSKLKARSQHSPWWR